MIKSVLRSLLALDSRWVYALSLYPALLALPYIAQSDRYASLIRYIYVLLCSFFALAMMVLLSSSKWNAKLKNPRDNSEKILYVIVIIYCLLTFYLAYAVRIRNGMSAVIDVANFEQVVWATSQGRFFFSSFNNGSYLSGHFPPIVILLALIYKAVPDVGTIFALQSTLFAAAALPLYFLLKEASGKFVALLISLSFLLNPAVISQHFNLYLNHFVPFFWLATSLAFWRRNFPAFIFCSLLTASVQEDVAFSLLVFGVMAWMENRSGRWKFFTFLFPLLWFVMAMLVIQSNASVTGKTLGDHFADLGRTPNEIMIHLLGNPEIILAKYSADLPSKIMWIYELFAPFLFVVPFASPMILAAVPDWLVFNFIPLSPDQYSVGWYYSLLITTVLFASLAFGLNKIGLASIPGGTRARVVKIVSILILSGNLVMLPLVLSPEMFRTDGGKRIATLNKINARIPSDACVIATTDVMQPFARRYGLYGLAQIADHSSECRHVVINRQFVESASSDKNLANIADEIRYNPNYELLIEENQIQLFVRK